VGTTSGRFGRKFDIVVSRILASVLRPVYHLIVSRPGVSMLVSSVFRLLSVCWSQRESTHTLQIVLVLAAK
jgi:hypothetical protein